MSIFTLSEFAIADASDDGSPVGSTLADTSDIGPLVGPTVVIPHEILYLDDGDVDMLCRITLFRVIVSALSLHSPALRQLFARTNPATAESPNRLLSRILSPDTTNDFAKLIKVVYHPGFFTLCSPADHIPIHRLPERNEVPGFTTFSSLLRITTKYNMPAVRSQLLEVVRDAHQEAFTVGLHS